MITIILKVNGSEKRFCFTKRSIRLGPKNSPDIDIPLPPESPRALIEEHNGRYWIQNVDNDPNLKFNNLPFGRRTLTKGSVISTKDAQLLIDAIDEVVEDRISSDQGRSFDEELALLMKQVDSLDVQSPPNEQDPPQDSPPPVAKKKFTWPIALGIVALLLISTFTATMYFSSHVKTEEEELKAARGVSDAAAALLFAGLHDIKPTNHNWSDPGFMNRILSEVVPKTSSTYCNIDSQGHFEDFPYILRVYTNDDASRFVLLAQPRPIFMSWFNSKDSIVIESSNMELRKIQDIQPLNRILFNAKELNGQTLNRIATLLKENPLIPLHKLDYANPLSQFSPPSDLNMLVPGAQNYVYNAPRYHKLTESILSEALSGDINPELLERMGRLMRVPHLVFYTTEGIKSAVKSYKNLSEYITSEKLLVGYFTYSSKTHLPTKTELLVMNQQQKSDFGKTNSIGLQKPPQGSTAINSEIYRTMTSLGRRRRQTLKPLADRIYQLVEGNNGTPEENFKEKLIAALKAYQQTDLIEQRKISAELRKLYKENVVENKELNSKHFFTYVNSTGLTPYVKKQEKKPAPRKYNPLIHADAKVKNPSQKADEKSALNFPALQ